MLFIRLLNVFSSFWHFLSTMICNDTPENAKDSLMLNDVDLLMVLMV